MLSSVNRIAEDACDGARAVPARAFLDFAARVRRIVERDLISLLASKVAWAQAYGRDPEAMVAAVQSLTLRGGKRLRAVLVAAGHLATATEGPPWDVSVRSPMVAMELLQTYLLIHDDWMDEDETRRGGPTVHAMLRGQYGSIHAGDIGAILAGDFAGALALEAMAAATVSAERRIAASQEFARIQLDVAVGQLLDVRAAATGHAQLEAMHDLKTGSYTVRGPLAIGAILGGASPEARAALDAFGAPLGVAFQLRDDLLGTFGDPRTTGKPAGSDLRQGKHTALVAEVAGDPVATAALARVHGVADAPAAEVQRVIEVLITSGARDRVERRLACLLDDAHRALERAPFSAAGRNVLAGAVRALGERAA
jgi:geranylgeranyl diphosphate synthase type I